MCCIHSESDSLNLRYNSGLEQRTVIDSDERVLKDIVP